MATETNTNVVENPHAITRPILAGGRPSVDAQFGVWNSVQEYKDWMADKSAQIAKGTEIGILEGSEVVIYRNDEDVDTFVRVGDRSATTTRMGYKILSKNKTFAEQVTQANTIYEIRDEITVGGTKADPVVIPENCVFLFNGGKLVGSYIEGAYRTVYVNKEFNSVKLSECGMIPDSPEHMKANSYILTKLLESKVNIIVDGFYHITGTFDIDYDLTMSGVNGGGFDVDRNGVYTSFKILNGGSITMQDLKVILHGIHFYGFIKTEGINYVIDKVIIQRCEFSGGKVLWLVGVDEDVFQNRSGVNQVIITDNYVHDIEERVFNISDLICFDIVNFSNNRAIRIWGTVMGIGTHNESAYAEEQTVLNCTYVVSSNYFSNDYIVHSYDYYTCLFLTDCNNQVIYENNTVVGVINMPPTTLAGTCYDVYASCAELVYKGNTVKDIAAIPLDKSGIALCSYGYAKVSPSNLPSYRHYIGNTWSTDFNVVRGKILEQKGIEFTDDEWKTVAGVRFIPFYTNTGELLFEGNYVDVKGGVLMSPHDTCTKNITYLNNIIKAESITKYFLRDAQLYCEKFTFIGNHIESNDVINFLFSGTDNKVADAKCVSVIKDNVSNKPLNIDTSVFKSIVMKDNSIFEYEGPGIHRAYLKTLSNSEVEFSKMEICSFWAINEYDLYSKPNTIIFKEFDRNPTFSVWATDWDINSKRFKYAILIKIHYDENLYEALYKLDSGVSYKFIDNKRASYIDIVSGYQLIHNGDLRISITHYDNLDSTDLTYHRDLLSIEEQGHKVWVEMTQVPYDFELGVDGDLRFIDGDLNTRLNGNWYPISTKVSGNFNIGVETAKSSLDRILSPEISSSYKKLSLFNEGYYINLNKNIGEVIDVSILTGSPTYSGGVFECSGYNKLILTGKGGTGPRLYGFLNYLNELIEVSKSGQTLTGAIIDIPSDAKYMVINSDNTFEGYLGIDGVIFEDLDLVKETDILGFPIYKKDLGRVVVLNRANPFKTQVEGKSGKVFEIRYDFDLGGQTVNFGENCILKFEGGSISNGTIVGNNTKVEGYHNISATYTGLTFEFEQIRLTSDGVNIQREGVALTHAQIYELLMDNSNDVYVVYQEAYRLRPGAFDGDAIFFETAFIIENYPWVARLVINSQNQVKFDEIKCAKAEDVADLVSIVEDSQMVVSMMQTNAQRKVIYDKCIAHPELAKNIVFLNTEDAMHYVVNGYKVSDNILYLNTIMQTNGELRSVSVQISSTGSISV